MSGRVAVIGGGVSGLTAAYRLGAAGIDATVLEAGATTGGKLRSVEVGGLRLPAGPDSFLARKPWAVELCRELGFGDELVAPRGRARSSGRRRAWFRIRRAPRSASPAIWATCSGGPASRVAAGAGPCWTS